MMGRQEQVLKETTVDKCNTAAISISQYMCISHQGRQTQFIQSCQDTLQVFRFWCTYTARPALHRYCYTQSMEHTSEENLEVKFVHTKYCTAAL